MRQEELDFIRLNDADNAQVWFLVDVEWLLGWKSWTKGDAPPPGPVDNSRLLNSSGRPRNGLEVVRDYRGVNYRMWTFWVSRYGGGPEVRRKELNLYSEEADDLDGTILTPSIPRDDLDAVRSVPRDKPREKPRDVLRDVPRDD